MLGVIQCLGVLCAAVAVQGSFSWPALLLGLALGSSIAANDILYACQDLDFDVQENLYSVPSRFGYYNALKIARGTHAVAFALLVAFGWIEGMSWLFFSGVGAIGIVFLYTHFSTEPLERRFAASNTYVGLLLLLFFAGDCLWRG